MIRALAGLALLASSAAAIAAPTLQIDRVVVVMRHGVRPPTSAMPMAPGIAADPWPAWPVPPGWLTPHGAEESRRLGLSDRAQFVQSGLMSQQGCPAAGTVRIISDGGDERTVATGESYALGIAPDCHLPTEHAPTIGQPDPVFSAVHAGAATFDPAKADKAIADADGPAVLAAASAEAAPLIARMNAILCGSSTAPCGLHDDGPLAIKPATATKAPSLSGALSNAGSGAQSLLLEYIDAKPMAEVGWGRATAADITALSALHALKFKLEGRPPYLAARTMAGITPLMRKALTADEAARVTVFAGHDSDLVGLGGMLDLHWQAAGFAPDDIPPGSALLVERLHDAAGHRYVRIAFRSFSLDGIRNLDARDVPARSIVAVPGCKANGLVGLCTLSDFIAKLDAAQAL
ncbi:histidine-type phosphatase [Sphingomonas nostoxanthinifaciens]|uniref:histidine-type phosphatase n=1 Tax=Sphingomonas nostoxanthinifaciens TaxID=2872652 RepID=UPI0037DA5DBC